jgi:hypothetical protein
MPWLVRTLRAWHLAILRYAVTLDNADRLAVFRISREIDGLHAEQKSSAELDFFRRTSTDLCAAIQQPNAGTSALLQQYLARIDDDRLKRTFAAAINAGQPAALPTSPPARTKRNLWKGLSSRSNH